MRVDEASGVSLDRNTNRLREFEFGAKLGCCDLFWLCRCYLPCDWSVLYSDSVSFTLIGGVFRGWTTELFWVGIN